MKALKSNLMEKGQYAESAEKAEGFLFNSYHNIREVIQMKRKYPNKIFVHRIDGPISFYSNLQDKRDDLIYHSNDILSDATVFQSCWSAIENKRMKMKEKHFERTIVNAPDPEIFFPKIEYKRQNKEKFKLIATSWSHNMKKGFNVYRWMDDNLDFNRYEMKFIGNSPIKFSNIEHVKPLASVLLAEELRKSDIFITASEKDPCSNSLIEALHCGLPAIALNDGGHPEIIGKGGELFNDPKEIPDFIKKISDHYDHYCRNIKMPTLEEVGAEYYNLMVEVCRHVRRRNIVKKISNTQYMMLKMHISQFEIHRRLLMLMMKFGFR